MSEDVSQTGRTGLDEDTSRRDAIFPGLVYNEQGERAEAVRIGGVAHYAIPDQGFLRHVEASKVDDVVIASLKEQITSVQGDVVEGILQLLGKDDLFTKSAVDASIRNLDVSIRQTDPAQWAPMLQLVGFRIVVDIHGDVVEIIYPTAPDESS